MELGDVVRALVSESDEGARGYLKQSWLSSTLDALIQVRRAAGLTQAQVAERLGTTQSAVARLERDADGGISLRRFVDYAIACGMVPSSVRFVSFASAKADATTPPVAPSAEASDPSWIRRGFSATVHGRSWPYVTCLDCGWLTYTDSPTVVHHMADCPHATTPPTTRRETSMASEHDRKTADTLAVVKARMVTENRADAYPRVIVDLAAANATIAALQADLAGTAELLLREQALAESRSLALATMREALRDTAVECRDFWMAHGGQPAGAWFACRICEAEGSDAMALAHNSSCILAQLDDAAAALAGAVLEAADASNAALGALLRHYERYTTHRCEIHTDAKDAEDAYRRARAALCGKGAVEE
jgi:transcriptional regulator with XRE-family HTH domain